MSKETAKKILKKVKADYNQYAEEFSRTRDKLGPDAEELARKYIKDGQKVLDLGCGNGRLLNSLKDKKIEYVGIDNSEELVNEAKRNLEIKKLRNWEIVLGDVLDLPVKDDQFDVVFCKAVLHHIPTRELQTKALGEMHRVLKPGGKLLLTNWMLLREVWDVGRIVILLYCYIVKSLNYLITWLLNYLITNTKTDDCLGFRDLLIPWGITGSKAKRYYYAFSLAEVTRLVKRTGFEINEAYYTDKKKRASFFRSCWRRGNLVVVGER